MKLKRTDGDWLWTNFKYEFLPTFCFICGIIGHSERFCHRIYDTPFESLEKPYGLWMKAQPQRKNKLIGARTLSADNNLPWCVIGDMNNVLSQEDKKGGAPDWLLEGFNQALIDSRICDLLLLVIHTLGRRAELRDGDNNNRYFHATATTRKRNNAITKLQGPNGDWCDWNSGLSNVIQGYFEDLFCSSNVNLAGVVDNICPSVTTQQNCDLLTHVTEEEVKSALFQMHPEKSPGPDGMTPGIFQKCWSIVKHDVVALYEVSHQIRGIQVANGAPFIFHMLFSDDSYIFCRANGNDSTNIINLLHDFELASGQKVNFSNFSCNTQLATCAFICQNMGIQEAGENSLYLGLPCTIGRNKNAVFGFLKDKASKKILRWEGRFLSKAGKELLLKTVSQALPNHAMSVFLLPLQTCKSLESTMSKYWWQSSKQSRGVSWMSWNKLCKHKHKGGLGFKDLRQYNLALLGKQAWRLLVHDSTLVSKVFKARYFPNSSFLSASLGSNPSYIWRSIFEAKDLIMVGARSSIASGIQTSILEDPWLPDVEDPFVRSVHPGLVNQYVASLMCVDSKCWDVEIIEDLFDTRDRDLIFNIPLLECLLVKNAYCWTWNKECSGLYTVKSAYWWLQNQSLVPGLDDGIWKAYWKIKVQPKVLHFGWRALTATLATKVELNTKHVHVNQLCIFCNMAEETIMHVLVQCPYAMSCWHRSSLNIISTVPMQFQEWFQGLMQTNTQEKIEETLKVSWAIWNARNNLMWNQKSATAAEVVLSARTHLYQWQRAQQSKFEPPLSHFEVGREVEHWTKPDEFTVKVNVDGSTFEASNAFSYGFISRDANGEIIDASCSSKSGTSSPEIVESLGIKEVLSWIKRKTWSKVVLETDCLIVVQAIHSDVVLPSSFGMLVQDCPHLLS
uniref:Reverse transcriptase zinc-binding domain-containing protein n=1 Tax=Cannabis sativa TaxID=3483 RepID=A0A803PHD5_CANSA